MLLTNISMLFGWARVLKLFYHKWDLLQDPTSPVCVNQLNNDVSLALAISFLELFNASIGLTRSKPHQVLLFSMVRFGVQILAAPLLPCTDWRHLLTIFCWSLGDSIRFFCFVLDIMVPQAHIAKAIRYTVGPVLFPVGALGEMLMIAEVARGGRPLVYIAAALWPLGFYPLYSQLLKQRKKFFTQWKEEATGTKDQTDKHK